MKNLFYFVFVLSLLVVFWQSNEEDFIFIIFTSNLSKVFQNDKRKNFQKHTHFTTTTTQTDTHTDIVVEKEKEKPRTRDDDNERRKR